MDIICLFAQRKCAYEGQYAPELLAAMDEYGNDDNPDYLNDEQDKADADDGLLFSKRITISVPQEKFDEVFFGKDHVDGTISPQGDHDGKD